MKTLIVSANAFSAVSNNGKTLEAIFDSFDIESLFNLYFRPQGNGVDDFSYAKSYYAISDIDVVKRLTLQNKCCGKIIEKNKSESKSFTQDYNIYRQIGNKSEAKKLIRDAIWATNVWKTDKLKMWCIDCNPDIIFTVLGDSMFMYKIVICILRWLNKPLVIFYTDDYLLYPKKKGLLGRIRHKVIDHYYKQIVNKASCRFCIGDMMAEEYSRYFGKRFYPIMNSVDIIPYQPPMFERKVLIISYFGGLHLNRWKMISRLSAIIGANGQINVYTGSELTKEMSIALNQPNINLCGFLQSKDLQQKILESDVLLHVESDDKHNRSLTRLSVSTKIPEYLIAGRLIIGYGPTEVASMKLLSDNRIGIVMSSDDNIDKQRNSIIATITDCALRLEYGKRAYDYAVSHFNKTKISQEFNNKLQSINNVPI